MNKKSRSIWAPAFHYGIRVFLCFLVVCLLIEAFETRVPSSGTASTTSTSQQLASAQPSQESALQAVESYNEVRKEAVLGTPSRLQLEVMLRNFFQNHPQAFKDLPNGDLTAMLLYNYKRGKPKKFLGIYWLLRKGIIFKGKEYEHSLVQLAPKPGQEPDIGVDARVYADRILLKLKGSGGVPPDGGPPWPEQKKDKEVSVATPGVLSIGGSAVCGCVLINLRVLARPLNALETVGKNVFKVQPKGSREFIILVIHFHRTAQLTIPN
jgi:hypothetical protein